MVKQYHLKVVRNLTVHLKYYNLKNIIFSKEHPKFACELNDNQLKKC